MYEPLKVVSWASAKADCPIRYSLGSHEDMTFIFGSGRDEFEFSFDAGALHNLLQLGAQALREMEAQTAREDDEDATPPELVAVGKRPEA